MALESLRTGQAGVVSLGLFITFGISTTAATYQRIQQLRQLVDTGWLLIAVMPAFFGFLAGPYYDYNSALL